MNRMPDETKIKQAKWKIEEWKQNNKLIPQVHLLRFRSVKRKQTLKDQKKRPNFNFIENFCCFLFVVFLKWKLEKKKDLKSFFLFHLEKKEWDRLNDCFDYIRMVFMFSFTDVFFVFFYVATSFIGFAPWTTIQFYTLNIHWYTQYCILYIIDTNFIFNIM